MCLGAQIEGRLNKVQLHCKGFKALFVSPQNNLVFHINDSLVCICVQSLTWNKVLAWWRKRKENYTRHFSTELWSRSYPFASRQGYTVRTAMTIVRDINTNTYRFAVNKGNVWITLLKCSVLVISIGSVRHKHYLLCESYKHYESRLRLTFTPHYTPHTVITEVHQTESSGERNQDGVQIPPNSS